MAKQLRLRTTITLVATAGLVTLLSACDNGSGGQQTPALFRNWIPGEYFNSANYRNYCANPRTGDDPFSGQPVRDRQGRTIDENNWLRAIHNEYYLWYDEIPDIYDPQNYTTSEYFALQKTTMPSDTGSTRDKDNFHFEIDTQDFFDSIVNGVNAGYGAVFEAISTSPPREVVVAFTEPNSEATLNSLSRGARIISVDGTLVLDGDASILNAGLFPADINEVHTFVVRDLGSMVDRTFNMTSAEVTSSPVQNAGIIPGSANVGYILFNDHIATSETQLIDAITLLSGLSVTDVVLDLRYNGGGFLDIASELAYMIAGNATTGLTFERMEFNDQYSSLGINPLTGSSLLTPFYSVSRGFSQTIASGTDLPTLNANNVVIITSGETCSASEAIINGLRAVPGVNVFQVGTTTCGKPYGNLALGNCGKTYLFTQFQGFNENDEGEYSDGFKPTNASGFGVPITGCAVADDFDHDLTDPLEANIATSLSILADPTNFDPATDCPAPPVLVTTKPLGQSKISTPSGSEQDIRNPNKRPLKIIF